MRVQIREIKHYLSQDGRDIFMEWLMGLSIDMRSRILIRLERVALGNFGDHSSVGENVWELRFHFGSGYRIYYVHEGTKIVLLLAGGDKSTQRKDIQKAKELWKEYGGRKNEI